MFGQPTTRRRRGRVMVALATVVTALLTSAPSATAAPSAPLDVPDGWEIVRGEAVSTLATTAIYSIAAGRYVTTEVNYTGGDENMLRARGPAAGAWEQYTFVYDAANEEWSIYSVAAGRYVTTEVNYTGGDDNMLRARGPAAGAWERFLLLTDEDADAYVFYSLAAGRYVTTEVNYTGGDENMLRARGPSIGAWERFYLF